MAQLPNGTISPDFTATDLNGVGFLYSYLDSGYQVIVDFNDLVRPLLELPPRQGGERHVRSQRHQQVRVFFIEGDDNTTKPRRNRKLHRGRLDGTPTPSSTMEAFLPISPAPTVTIYTLSQQFDRIGTKPLGHEVLNSATCMPASLANDALLMDRGETAPVETPRRP